LSLFALVKVKKFRVSGSLPFWRHDQAPTSRKDTIICEYVRIKKTPNL
jgi:hypothetical protein